MLILFLSRYRTRKSVYLAVLLLFLLVNATTMTSPLERWQWKQWILRDAIGSNVRMAAAGLKSNLELLNTRPDAVHSEMKEGQ